MLEKQALTRSHGFYALERGLEYISNLSVSSLHFVNINLVVIGEGT